MKVTRRQIRQIIREAVGSTKKYDDDSALKGTQSKLPDALQKSIIDKSVEDREDEEDEKEKNESLGYTRKQLQRLIKEAIDYRENVNASYNDVKGSQDIGSASAKGLAHDMQIAWEDSNSGLNPEGWATEQGGVLVEAVAAEYMDKMNMPSELGTTDAPMLEIRKQAMNMFLNME